MRPTRRGCIRKTEASYASRLVWLAPGAVFSIPAPGISPKRILPDIRGAVALGVHPFRGLLKPRPQGRRTGSATSDLIRL
jgi:hypothetical protein